MPRTSHEPWYRFAALVLRPLMIAVAGRDWRATERLPRDGGIVVVPNHISHIDPLAVAHFLYDNGRRPRFLAKASLFHIFFVRRVLRGAKQIPVYRETAGARDALRDAIAAVRAGECVVVYAEGTLTRDPHGWPMAGKSGAARIALETGCPVLPMAAWGPQDLLPPYAKRPHLVPRPTMHVIIGEPVDLDDLRGRPLDGPTLNLATERIMDAVTALVAELRHEDPPPTRVDPRGSGVARIGDPGVAYDLGDGSGRRADGRKPAP